jgi:HPt (histidine-containing phosphotransfer) domain-containing protein
MFLQNGFNDFISKPIDIVKLNCVLERWIPKEKHRAAKKTCAGKDTDTGTTIEGVDIKLGLGRTGGTVGGYLQTLAVFRKDAADKINDIRKSLETNDLPLYVTHIHALKSAAANIGAAKLSEEAKKLEEAGRREDAAFIKERTPWLLADLESLLRSVDGAVSAQNEKNGKTGIDKEALKTALADTRKAINDINPAAISAAARELRHFENAAEIGDDIENILQHVLNGEYDEALSLIEDLSP